MARRKRSREAPSRAVATFTVPERRLIARLPTPAKVQRWLRSLPYNYEVRGETLRTFRVVAQLGTAHCLEAALSAATVMEAHGRPPVLLDMESIDDLDHVVFLYREGERWGTVAKSRDPGLFGRKPVFRSIRDLVWSYFDPYIDMTGRINGYGVLDLRTLRGVDWRTSRRNAHPPLVLRGEHDVRGVRALRLFRDEIEVCDPDVGRAIRPRFAPPGSFIWRHVIQ